jgi:hypothetical protein
MSPLKADADELGYVMLAAQQKAEVIYVRAIRRVLARCRSLDYYIDAMGAQFFVDRDNNVVEYDDLPRTAREYIAVAQPYFDAFGSLGWQIHRDKIIENW